MFARKGLDRRIYEISVLYDFFSLSFSNDDFSSFINSTKFKIKMSQLIAQMFQAGAVKVKHDLLLVVVQVNQRKT